MAGAVAQGELIEPVARAAALASSIEFSIASRRDDAALRQMLRDNLMPGPIGLSLECEPSFFDAIGIQGERCDVLVARDAGTGSIVAMGSRSVREVFVNGEVARLGYLSQLRIDAAWRGRRRLLIDGYAHLGSLRRDNELPFDLTTVMADNRVARRLLTAGVRGLPHYLELDRLVTLAIPVAGRRIGVHARLDIAPASPHEVPEIVDCFNRNNSRLQLAPRWVADDLLSLERCRGLRISDFHLARCSGRLVGCIAVWDQRHFKQTVVRRHAPGLRFARPVFNCVAPLMRQPRLPAVGRPLRSAFISHLAVDDDNPEIATSLIESARRRARERALDVVLIGLAARRPLLDALRRCFPHRSFESIMYLVDWTRPGAAPFALDECMAHVELATL